MIYKTCFLLFRNSNSEVQNVVKHQFQDSCHTDKCIGSKEIICYDILSLMGTGNFTGKENDERINKKCNVASVS